MYLDNINIPPLGCDETLNENPSAKNFFFVYPWKRFLNKSHNTQTYVYVILFSNIRSPPREEPDISWLFLSNMTSKKLTVNIIQTII